MRNRPRCASASTGISRTVSEISAILWRMGNFFGAESLPERGGGKRRPAYGGVGFRKAKRTVAAQPSVAGRDHFCARYDGCGAVTRSSSIAHHPSCIFRLGIARSRRQAHAARRHASAGPASASPSCIFGTNTFRRFRKPAQRSAGRARCRRALRLRCASLARYLASRPDLRDISVICGDVPSRHQGAKPANRAHHGLLRLRDGHGDLNDCRSRERIHRFGENILISLIVFAQNAAALRLDTLNRVRVPIYLSRRTLERKFGDVNEAAAGSRGGVMSIVQSIPDA